MLSQPWSHPVLLNTGHVDWESSALTTRPLFHKGDFHRRPLIIAHTRGLYLMWYLNKSWKLLLENPQHPLTTPWKNHFHFKIQNVHILIFGQYYKFFSPPFPRTPCRNGGRTLQSSFSFTCGIVFHCIFRFDVLSQENISTLWSFGGMYILPSPVF